MTPFFGGVLLLAACGGLVPTHGAVIELDDNSFYNYAKDRDVLLVDFYAPWCSDCKNLEPDFQAAGASLGARSIDLAKVDCFGAGKGLCTKYGVKQWPTLKNFNRGTYTGDYTGGLSAGEIAGYVNTVENSVSSQVVSNPYAAPYTPMVMQTQQCVSRCKISKITNKAPCYAKCKTPKPAVRKMLPQPVINEKSCAKCRQPQISGKFRANHTSSSKEGQKKQASQKRHNRKPSHQQRNSTRAKVRHVIKSSSSLHHKSSTMTLPRHNGTPVKNKLHKYMVVKVQHGSVTKLKQRHRRQLQDEHYQLYQIGYSGLPKLKERQLMNTYLDKILNDFKISQQKENANRDYSGMTKTKERMVMDQYMSKEVLSALNNKTTDFNVESKNVKGPTLGTLLSANQTATNNVVQKGASDASESTNVPQG